MQIAFAFFDLWCDLIWYKFQIFRSGVTHEMAKAVRSGEVGWQAFGGSCTLPSRRVSLALPFWECGFWCFPSRGWRSAFLSSVGIGPVFLVWGGGVGLSFSRFGFLSFLLGLSVRRSFLEWGFALQDESWPCLLGLGNWPMPVFLMVVVASSFLLWVGGSRQSFSEWGVSPSWTWPSMVGVLARPSCIWGWPFLLRVGTGPSLLASEGEVRHSFFEWRGLAILGLGPRSEGWSSPLEVGVWPFLLEVGVGLVFSGCGGWPS